MTMPAPIAADIRVVDINVQRRDFIVAPPQILGSQALLRPARLMRVPVENQFRAGKLEFFRAQGGSKSRRFTLA
jgi:hypothetical protein